METFYYTEDIAAYLSKKDKRMGEVICRLGHIERPVQPDLFTSLMHSIVGQQISAKAQQTVWKRLEDSLTEVTPCSVSACEREALQGLGLSYRKADYMQSAAKAVLCGSLDLEALSCLDDQEVQRELCALKGIGEWTAEMLMLFSMQRQNILSYKDYAIQKGLRMIYHHRHISRERFERYRKRFSPFCSVASLYIWAVAGGAIEGMKDYGRN